MTIAEEQNMSKQTFSARDYIQDSLIAMWDGIENIGYAKHDSTASIWKDLIGNLDLVAQQPIFSQDSAIVRSSANMFSVELPDSLVRAIDCGDFTIEVCVGTTDKSNELGLWNFGYVDQFQTGLYVKFNQRTNTVVTFRLSEKCILDLLGGKQKTTYSAQVGSGIVKIFNDGVVLLGQMAVAREKKTHPNAFYVGSYKTAVGTQYFTRGEIHCIRFYNRALDALEIESNFKVDKERFGI